MYNYKEQKPHVMTDEGQRDFLKVRDHVNRVLDQAGCVDMRHAFKPVSGDSWTMMAYVDRMVELGELREIQQSGHVAGQHRIFVRINR